MNSYKYRTSYTSRTDDRDSVQITEIHEDNKVLHIIADIFTGAKSGLLSFEEFDNQYFLK
jgi:hypothetical protein